MVQRKGPDLIGSIPEPMKDHTKTEKRLYSHQNQEPKSKDGGDLKKKMKKLRSIKRISELENFESHLGQQHVQLKRTSSGKKPPSSKVSSKNTSPNYMKSTTSSDARKERLKVSTPHTPGDKKRSPKKSNNLNLAEASSASSRLNKVFKSFTRKPSLKLSRPMMKKSLGALLFPKINVSGATCSSTLKDSKFPKELELTPGATEAEGTSSMKVCPYTYCSLNGHWHEPLPPLKPFLSARRRLLKTQKSMKLKALSSFRKKGIRSIQKQIDLAQDEPEEILSSSEDFPLIEDLDDDFFIEIHTGPQEKLVELASNGDNMDNGKDFNDERSDISVEKPSSNDDGENRRETEDCKSCFVSEIYYQTSPEDNLDHNDNTSVSELGPQINIHMAWLSQTEILEVDSLKDGNPIDESNTFEPYGLVNNSDNDHEGEGSGNSFNHLNSERNLESSHVELQEPSGITENNDTSCAGSMPVFWDSEDRSLEERKEDSESRARIHIEFATCLKDLINDPTDQQTASVEFTTQNMVVSKQKEQCQSTEEDSQRNNAIEETRSLFEIKVPSKGTSEDEVVRDDEDDAKAEPVPEGFPCTCIEVNTKGSADTDIILEPLLSKNEEDGEEEEDDDDDDDDDEEYENEEEDKENFHTFNGNRVKPEKDQFQATESYHLKITAEKSDGMDYGMLDADIDKVEEQEYWLACGPISDEDIAALDGSLINSSALLHGDGNELKARMRIVKKRVDVDSEELKPFNPRSPNFLSVEPDPEKEKVDLRHQMMDGRKNAEEWMIDYALQQAVTKLSPARKRKVALLVEAFETVMPLTTYEEPLGDNSPNFAHGRPMQACS